MTNDKVDLTLFPIAIPPGLPPDIEQNWEAIRILMSQFESQFDERGEPVWKEDTSQLKGLILENSKNIELLFSLLKDTIPESPYWKIEGDYLVPSGYGGGNPGDLWRISGNYLVPTGNPGTSDFWEIDGDYLVPKVGDDQYWEIDGDYLVPTGFAGNIPGNLFEMDNGYLVPTGLPGVSQFWEIDGDYLVPKI